MTPNRHQGDESPNRVPSHEVDAGLAATGEFPQTEDIIESDAPSEFGQDVVQRPGSTSEVLHEAESPAMD